MKVGVFTVLFAQRPLEEALDYIAAAGVEMVELGTGNYPGPAHCNPDELLGNKAAQKKLLDAVASRGLEISALSCHGNPVHPNKEFAKSNHEVFRKTVQLAKELGIKTVINFSGCPGDGPNATKPNWVTCAWPPDYAEILEWQWNECLIPYWKEQAAFLKDNGVRVAFEMHPGFCVYNVDSMLRIREACGDAIGCNFDPSHLFWNGVDVCAAIRKLGDAIYHVHAKDCKIDTLNTAVNGCNDTTSYLEESKRSWIFRTVGYGHDAQTWKDIVSTLKLVGYDHVLSIEHEDSLMSVNEGFQKAVAFLKDVVISENAGEIWWA
ncbi:MAG: sugar phosphate isomerase/epimerase family protein [Armatimonadota bacterium]